MSMNIKNVIAGQWYKVGIYDEKYLKSWTTPPFIGNVLIRYIDNENQILRYAHNERMSGYIIPIKDIEIIEKVPPKTVKTKEPEKSKDTELEAFNFESLIEGVKDPILVELEEEKKFLLKNICGFEKLIEATKKRISVIDSLISNRK